MSYKPGCGHKWVTMEGRQKQLRCEWCGALGYTRGGLPGARKAPERIYVYICDVKDCHRDAVELVDGRRLCSGHAKRLRR